MTLFERSDALGGQVARQRVGGVDLDAAAESFATRGGAVAALLRGPRPRRRHRHAAPLTRVAASGRRHRRAPSGHGGDGHPRRSARRRCDPRHRPARCVARPARRACSRRAGGRMPRPSASSSACGWAGPWPTVSSRRSCAESTRPRSTRSRSSAPTPGCGPSCASAARSPPRSARCAPRRRRALRSPASGAACSGWSTRWRPTARASASTSSSARTSRQPIRTASRVGGRRRRRARRPGAPGRRCRRRRVDASPS